ncbi:alpha/beta fold hydrolase [Vitiosangium sp. GDMCC 1.1324]|uniref:alpha/beta fold hydrolase n=1 Tax=Vitiosangium sp. (strain GDMCC 1.1324) TaxID=2138576 RepID=UPI000D3B755E|nr:alpha/beta hydrolase [Vitiosangium sp. GDMCC 1.1324]PTL85528.1 alpha/beta hydrolase [Vitiosangium sp. GDMCC 1.1324]
MSNSSPFRNEAARTRYLAAYDEWSTRWPLPSDVRLVPTSYGSTFVRGSGPTDAPAIVLLPGAGSTSLMWAPNVPALATHHRVWAVDSIADYGRSEPSRPVRTAQDFVTWLDELTGVLAPDQPFGLAGVSYGAWIAAQYALARPGRLSALALIAPAGTVMPLGLGFMFRAVSCALPSPFFTRRFMTWLAHDLATKDAASRLLLEQRVQEGYLAIRSFKARRLVEPSILSDEQLRGLPTPTLFMVGENERIFSATAAIERLRRVAPGIDIELVPGAGHDVTLVQAERVTARLMDLFGGGTSLPAATGRVDPAPVR